MTTIAYRAGVIAADSRMTVEDESAGTHYRNCQKLYRKIAYKSEVIIATAGEGGAGDLFVNWYGSKKEPPAILATAEFRCLVLDNNGLWEFDKYCHPEKITEEFWAIGSGAKAALGAMHAGADAPEAVLIAIKVCNYSGGPVHSMSLKKKNPLQERVNFLLNVGKSAV